MKVQESVWSKPVGKIVEEHDCCGAGLGFAPHLNANVMGYLTPNTQYLKVKGPDDKERFISLNDQKLLKIGRDETNDIRLFDQQRRISRLHFELEREDNYWRVVVKSRNGIYIQRGISELPTEVPKDERFLLQDGDSIFILGKAWEQDENKIVIFKLQFMDKDGTDPISGKEPPPDRVEYSLSQEKIFCVVGGRSEEIALCPQERAMLHYMAKCNLHNNEPILCSHEDLIEKIWGKLSYRTESDVTQLVCRVRKKLRSQLEATSVDPEFIIETVPKRGYILKVTLK